MSTNKNKVHYDLTNVHFAPITIDGDVVTFGTPEREYGAISMDLSPKGDTVNLRADAIDYYSAVSNNGYDGSIDFAQVSDNFRQKYLGYTMSATDKVLIEDSQAEHKPFAMLYEFLGDKHHRRHVLYNGMATRPNEKGENKENQKEADTESLPVNFSPLPNGRVKASTTADTPDEVYAKWFESVWEKDITAAAEAAQTNDDEQSDQANAEE